ncbi:hypothetical protein DET1593 [Dehalococcoides mccartyi 195]|uniref:Uncharacterized protein n=1 Tax=Dehalococcoides mccartyi (strain ATCC BAA-2266 / KCTC 15142 / 195) TaxID=243164 RepID=Q3Z660_DEHM1|nr:hypothetical protein DET1593 [Dehalococcoides mccartyi 195]
MLPCLQSRIGLGGYFRYNLQITVLPVVQYQKE